ncbi:hypothetical protein G9A89_007440 [Geosiphon pyriformis]|nr:hypothetical protein G9A89_007440 [Geosiphon pyriformis]
MGFSLSVALLNKKVSNSSSILKRNIAASDSSSVTVAGKMLLMLYTLKKTNAQTIDKLVQNLWCCKIVSLDCLNLMQVPVEVSQVSGNCFGFFLFNCGEGIG